jgi:hypothetical protein
MPAWLSDEWVAASGEAVDLAAPLDATVEVAVLGVAGGDVRYHRSYKGGRVVAAGPGPAGAADVTLTLPEGEARDVLAGRLDPSVAFMQGRLKTAGNNGLLLELLAAWSSPSGKASIVRIRELTDAGSPAS